MFNTTAEEFQARKVAIIDACNQALDQVVPDEGMLSVSAKVYFNRETGYHAHAVATMRVVRRTHATIRVER